MIRKQAHQVIDQLFDLGQTLVGARVPAEARQHFQAARREALLGVRTVVDRALARLEAGEPSEGPEGGDDGKARAIPLE